MEKILYPIDETFSDVTNNRCPILYAMKILGSKYKLPTLWYLHEKNSTRYPFSPENFLPYVI